MRAAAEEASQGRQVLAVAEVTAAQAELDAALQAPSKCSHSTCSHSECRHRSELWVAREHDGAPPRTLEPKPKP